MFPMNLKKDLAGEKLRRHSNTFSFALLEIIVRGSISEMFTYLFTNDHPVVLVKRNQLLIKGKIICPAKA